jgi:hypothetical protein
MFKPNMLKGREVMIHLEIGLHNKVKQSCFAAYWITVFPLKTHLELNACRKEFCFPPLILGIFNCKCQSKIFMFNV